MSTSPRRYTPLNTATAEIRVMLIDQTSELSEIVCTLQTIPLASASPFYALSYVWGDGNDMQVIKLDGERVKTRKNLCDFIRSLRVAIQGPIKIWVDYLCINQDDLDERAAQVAMMGQIYSRADSVYAWLGPSTADAERIFDFVEQSKIQRLAGETYWKIYMSDPTISDAFDDLLRRPYWTRLWILQEIVLAKRLWLFSGSRYISWDDLHFVLAGTKGSGSLYYARNSSQETTRLLQYLKESRDSPSALSLSSLVHKFHTAQCHDGRDKIYGLLSLAHQDTTRHVKVDYRSPLLQVLLDTYATWASEWVLDQDDACDTNIAEASYTPSLFCHELEFLFPEKQLLDLYDDDESRRQIIAKVTLKGYWQSRIFEFKHIATIPVPEEQFIPVSQSKSISQRSFPSHTLSQMITSARYDTFAYTTILPLPTDMVVNLGPMILIVRQKDGQYFVAGRGIQQRCTATECIFDPRLWRAQLLPDSIFELKYEHSPDTSPARRSSTRRKNHFVNVTLNAAALVEVLIANKEQDRTWEPHEFGLQHSIIDMCKDCRLSTSFGRRGPGTKPCRCIWSGQGVASSLSSQFRGLRRHHTVAM